jgi:chromosome segregation ATPase
VPSAHGGSGEELGKIRNLLFGAQMDQMENRIDQLEARMKEASDGLSSSFTTEISDLRKEISNANKKLEKTLAAIQTSLEQLSDTKTDRSQLSGLLRGLADKIGGE